MIIRILVIALFSVISLHGQNSSLFDSLRRNLPSFKEDTNAVINYQTLSRKYRKLNQDSCFYFADKAIYLAKKLKNKRHLIAAYQNKGSAYKQLGEHQKAIDTLLFAYELSVTTPEKYGLISICQDLGVVYRLFGNYEKSLFYFQLEATEAAKINNVKALFDSYNSLANTFNMMGINKKSPDDLENALKYYETAKKYVDSTNLTSMSMLLMNTGVAYFNAGIFNSDSSYFYKAIDYAEKALGYSIKTRDSSRIALCYSNLAGAYHQLCAKTFNDKYMQKSKKYYEYAINILEKLNDYYIYNEYFNYGSHLALYGMHTRNTALSNEGIKYLEKALEMSKQYNDVFSVVNSYRSLAETYAELKNYPKAFDNLRHHILLRDSLLPIENKQIAEEMAAKFESDLKDAENKNLKEQADLREEVIAKKTNTIKLTIGSSVLLALLTFWVFQSRQKINKAKTLIEKQKKDTDLQKQIIEEKNKEIIDSINYAKRLQNAAMPSIDSFKKYLPESFVFYKPKDIVAGDFYWIYPLKNGNEILVAAADCTGHGVPGALVSIVCLNALNRCVEEFNLTLPNEILDKTTEIISQSFRQNENDVKDGMDISLALIDKVNNTLMFAGANNSAILLKDSDAVTLPADKQPVGIHHQTKPFSLQKINFQSQNKLLLFSDGYIDQFGGENGKKFKSKQFREMALQFADKSSSDFSKELENRFYNWKGSLDQVDDVLVIGITL